jgi:hypothetical protein
MEYTNFFDSGLVVITFCPRKLADEQGKNQNLSGKALNELGPVFINFCLKPPGQIGIAYSQFVQDQSGIIGVFEDPEDERFSGGFLRAIEAIMILKGSWMTR